MQFYKIPSRQQTMESKAWHDIQPDLKIKTSFYMPETAGVWSYARFWLFKNVPF